MTTIYLVRHAKYANPTKILPGRLPVILSEDGVAQAHILHQYFADKNIAQIYSSPVLRCKQTAEIIAGSIIPIEYDVRLAETLCANQGANEVDNWRKQLYGDALELGGESQIDVQNRMAEFWKTADFQDGKSYIICSHGDPLLFLYQYLTDQDLNNDLNINELGSYQQKASVRIVEYISPDKYTVHDYISNENLLS
jgi:broad specificity phosphatase PhoE